MMEVGEGRLVVSACDGKRDSTLGDMASVTTLLFLPVLGDTLVAVVVVVVVDMAGRWC